MLLPEFRPRNRHGSSVTDNGPGAEAKRSIRILVPTPDRRAATLSATSLRVMKKPLTGSVISDFSSTQASNTPARLNTRRLVERPSAAPVAKYRLATTRSVRSRFRMSSMRGSKVSVVLKITVDDRNVAR